MIRPVLFFALILASVAAAAAQMTLSSPAFADGQPIPLRYAQAGRNTHPPLRISHVPPGTASLALIVDDPDAPRGTFTHWLVWNLPPQDVLLAEGELPGEAVTGGNQFGHAAYDGPRPPSGVHHYRFQLFALDRRLDLPPGSPRAALEQAMAQASGARVLEATTLTGDLRGRDRALTTLTASSSG